MFKLSKYLPLPPLIRKYIAKIIYISSIMSLNFVLFVTNESNRVYSASMDEVFIQEIGSFLPSVALAIWMSI